jgi:hypothetical protein
MSFRRSSDAAGAGGLITIVAAVSLAVVSTGKIVAAETVPRIYLPHVGHGVSPTTLPTATSTPPANWSPKMPALPTLEPSKNLYRECLVRVNSYSGSRLASASLVEHNALGDVVREMDDVDADGAWDWSSSYIYEDLKLRRVAHDRDGDGANDIITQYEYDDRHNLVSTLRDGNGDGVVDHITSNQYGTHSELLQYAVDHGADGSIDSSGSYRYDMWGFLESLVEDASLTSSVKTYRWERSLGLWLGVTTQIGADSTIIEHRYDGQNRVVAVLRGATPTSLTLVRAIQYDASGRVSLFERYRAGALESRATWHYDSGGRLDWIDQEGHVPVTLIDYINDCPAN